MQQQVYNHTERDPDAARQIAEITGRIGLSKTKGELGTILASEARKYSILDLQIIGGRLNSEIELLSSPYRESVRPFFAEQLFGRHHRLLLMQNTGKYAGMTDPIRNPEAFHQFCSMLPSGCFSWNDHLEQNPHYRNPMNRLFYYLIAAFAMFVLDEPGHPAGMPFPGGLTVESRGQGFYCPVRDKEKDVPYSLCNFCPAQQSDTS
jgi:uncharacterized protein (UPF0305 family)